MLEKKNAALGFAGAHNPGQLRFSVESAASTNRYKIWDMDGVTKCVIKNNIHITCKKRQLSSRGLVCTLDVAFPKETWILQVFYFLLDAEVILKTAGLDYKHMKYPMRTYWESDESHLRKPIHTSNLTSGHLGLGI